MLCHIFTFHNNTATEQPSIFVGADFLNMSIPVTVPEGQQLSFELPSFIINIVDDDIDEDEQSFAVVANIGPDVPDGVGCFKLLFFDDAECHGRLGATELIIIDDDGELHPCLLVHNCFAQ